MSKIIIGLILGLIIAGAAFGAYNIGKKQSAPSLTPQVSTAPSLTPSLSASPDRPISLRERPTAGFVNPSGTIAAINDAFKKGDKAIGGDVGAWMANPVDVILFATECCGNKTRKEASNQLDNFVQKGQSPWDCSDTNPVTKLVLSKDSQSFKDMTICTSANRLLVGFHLDNEFLIDRISLVNDYKQITGQ